MSSGSRYLISLLLFGTLTGSTRAQTYLYKIVDEGCLCIDSKLHLIKDSVSYGSIISECIILTVQPYGTSLKEDFGVEVETWREKKMDVIDNDFRMAKYLFNLLKSRCASTFALAEQSVELFYERNNIPWIDTLQRAIEFAYEGKYENAHAVLERARAQQLQHFIVYQIDALIYDLEKRYVAGINSLDKAIEMEPHNARNYLIKAEIYGKMGAGYRFESIKTYTELLKQDTGNAEAYYYRGFAYWKYDSPQKAIRDLNKVIDNPEFQANAFMIISFCFQEIGELQKALQACDSAQKFNPTNHVLFLQRGEILIELNDVSSACEAFHEAQKKGNENAKYYIKRYCK